MLIKKRDVGISKALLDSVNQISYRISFVFLLHFGMVSVARIFVKRESSLQLLSYPLLYSLFVGLAIIQRRWSRINTECSNYLNFREGVIYFFAQFFNLPIIIVIKIIILRMGWPEYPNRQVISFDEDWRLWIIFLVGPIMEEIIFRKLIGDRLLPDNPSYFLILSTFLFGLAHLQTLDLGLLIAASYSGFVWSLLYLRSGSWI
ncbi:CPBP family intramembrane glutamic endopeptidase [Hutsoniella sourekii]|uniref:CPBP family intramembrane glutamic endopeptidase n=1 Tax=Hutsoniella sourekii TaxID=87650 RepID=UPI0004885364|nr:CPBP family intramembrane glutamic endopeptidase [Hutsoniella sourekii]